MLRFIILILTLTNALLHSRFNLKLSKEAPANSTQFNLKLVKEERKWRWEMTAA